MKKLAFLSVILLVLAACGGEELPPTPPPPGGQMVGGAIAGMAVGMPTWAAEPRNVGAQPFEVFFNDGVIVSASNYDYIYQNGYFFNSQIRTWQKFSLEGESVEQWVKSQAIGSIPIDPAVFKEGENYAVVYACNKDGRDWNCNGNKWMLVKFMVKGQASGAIPEAANAAEFVLDEIVPPFIVSGTTAEQDNFGDVNVIRYDAKYQAPQGLTVLAHVFDFNNRGELDTTLRTYFANIINKGWTQHNGQNLGLFLAENDHRIAVWSSGKALVYIETFDAEAANKEIIDAYLRKYPSDLTKI